MTFFQLNLPYNFSTNLFFVDSNDLEIKMCTCDRAGMIKSTTNGHIKLFARPVVPVTLRYDSSSAYSSVKVYHLEQARNLLFAVKTLGLGSQFSS